jgi:hypothetical protein
LDHHASRIRQSADTKAGNTMMSNTYTNRRRQAVLEAQTAAAVKREQTERMIRREDACERIIRKDASRAGR